MCETMLTVLKTMYWVYTSLLFLISSYENAYMYMRNTSLFIETIKNMWRFQAYVKLCPIVSIPNNKIEVTER